MVEGHEDNYNKLNLKSKFEFTTNVLIQPSWCQGLKGTLFGLVG